MDQVNQYILNRLTERKQADSFRALQAESDLSDFCSNDYLGFARSEELKQLIEKSLAEYAGYQIGSAGSRLLSGNSSFIEDLESEIASFHSAEASLIFNSGYDANLGLFSCVPARGDTIITDEYIHASIIDGARLSYANRYIFKHNDLTSLKQKLQAATGRVYIAVESIYSMDGDEAPLSEICQVATEYNAAVIVDEAHATGVFGTHGRGLVEEYGLNDQVFAKILTFGKALGVHGAAIIGSTDLRSYLVNFSRSFIYTTAAPFINALSVKSALNFLTSRNHQSQLAGKIELFRSQIKSHVPLMSGRSPIQIIYTRGNSTAKNAASECRAAGYDVRAILSPTVPQGAERLRVCIHNHNTHSEIVGLSMLLNDIFK